VPNRATQVEGQALSDEDEKVDDERVREGKIKADWKDHVAIAVAMLETVLLPIVVALAIMVALVIVLYLR
jgi:hypothetical protein